MAGALDTWPRSKYAAGGDPPFLFFRVYGDPKSDSPISRSKYRCEGVPDGLRLTLFDRIAHEEVFHDLLAPPLGEVLGSETPDLVQLVRQSRKCCELRGDVVDASSLNYLRDAVGLITWMLDHGGRLVYDPQQLRCWTPDSWREMLFEPNQVCARKHCVVLYSDDADATPTRWFHTRGMRQFGRPDISIRHVPDDFHDLAIEICNRFIDLQADGAIVENNARVRVAGWPGGSTVRLQGDFDDPDFNNKHLEIVVPAWHHRAL